MSWSNILEKFSHLLICEINEPTNFELAEEVAPILDFGKIETPHSKKDIESHVFPIEVSDSYNF